MEGLMAFDKKIKETLFEAGVSRLIDWLGDKGWSIDFDYLGHDEIDPNIKHVTISTRQGQEKQFYSFLHECGHILIQQNQTKYEKEYPAQAKRSLYATNSRIERTPKYRVEVLTEEIEAWRRGKKLAQRLGIYIDDENYDKLAAKCVYTYIEWANGKDKNV